jgi:hypothetical protein
LWLTPALKYLQLRIVLLDFKEKNAFELCYGTFCMIWFPTQYFTLVGLATVFCSHIDLGIVIVSGVFKVHVHINALLLTQSINRFVDRNLLGVALILVDSQVLPQFVCLILIAAPCVVPIRIFPFCLVSYKVIKILYQSFCVIPSMFAVCVISQRVWKLSKVW